MNKNRIYSLIFLTLILTGLFANSTLVLAQTTAPKFTKEEVCKYVNYQYASVKDTQESKDIGKKFEGKFITITEERLGNPDGETTFNCFRQIVCSMENPKTSTAKPSGGEAAKEDQATAGDAKVVQVRKCTTTYEPKCEGQSGDDLIQSMSNPKGEYTICEPVMIYLSDPGNNLLFYYMGQVYTFAATLGGLLAVLILIVAGIMYTTAGDNTNQTTMAKGLITKSLSGLIVLFLSALILYVINPNFFTANQTSNESTTPTTNEANP